MKQPIKGKGKVKRKKPRNPYRKNPFTSNKRKITNEKYGTSQLERDFAEEFLEKNNIPFIYQYEAKEIGRYFDFAILSKSEKNLILEEKDGIMSVKQSDNVHYDIQFLLEIDGDYWHVNPEKFDSSKLTPTQKHNLFVDKLKDQYAGLHCVPLLRIWENDIRKHPKKVLEELNKYISVGEKKRNILENRRKPH